MLFNQSYVCYFQLFNQSKECSLKLPFSALSLAFLHLSLTDTSLQHKPTSATCVVQSANWLRTIYNKEVCASSYLNS